MIAPVPCAIASITENKINCKYTREETNDCETGSECSSANDCPSNRDCNDNDCSNSLCCNIQCCNCYFIDGEINGFNCYVSSINKFTFPENEKITSSFCGECWQPPEQV